MKILTLDLSTKTGWSVFENGKLTCYGQIKNDFKLNEDHPTYPGNYLEMAIAMSKDVLNKAITSRPDLIVIEETNKGKNRYSQKQLEFIHCKVTGILLSNGFDVHYIDTSEWRSLLGISLDKEQRQDNKEILNARKAEFHRIFVEVFDSYQVNRQTELAGAKGKREQNKINKRYEGLARTKTKERMRSFRFKEEGKVKGKVGTKQLSVNFVNETFSLKLKLKDNDIADAICLGAAFIKKKGYYNL